MLVIAGSAITDSVMAWSTSLDGDAVMWLVNFAPLRTIP